MLDRKMAAAAAEWEDSPQYALDLGAAAEPVPAAAPNPNYAPRGQRPWVLASDGSHYPFGVLCQHCGAFERIETPIPATDFSAALAAFSDAHGGCLHPVAGAERRLHQEAEQARRAG